MMLFFGLTLLVTVLIKNGFSLECYSSQGHVVEDRDHEQTLPTETCEGRCYIRSNQNTQQVIMRGCTANFSDLPNTGCYIFPTDTWCLCAEELCNFGPMGWGEYDAPHVRMAREINVLGRGRRDSLQHTLRDPFKEEVDGVQKDRIRDPMIDRYRAMENLGVGSIKTEAHAEGKFAISNGTDLATDFPKVSLRMGEIPKSQTNRSKFSLHDSPQSRTKRKPKRIGSIFTRDGRIANNDYWTDEWSKPTQSDWQTTRHREQAQTTRPREVNNYDYDASPTEQAWGQDNRVYERNTNSYTLNQRNRYQDERQNHEDRELHNEYGQRQTHDRQMNHAVSEELESWEAEGPVEIDDSFWDFSALIESSESDSVFPGNNAQAPNYRRTTKRAWSRQTTTPVRREWNYRPTTQSPIWINEVEEPRETVQQPSFETDSNDIPVPSLIGKVQGMLESENNIENANETPEYSAGVKKIFTKGFFYKNPGEREEIVVSNRPKSATSPSFQKITTKKPVETTKLTTTEKTTPSTTQTETPTTAVPTTEATTVTTTRRTTTTLAPTITTTTPTKTTVKHRKLAKAERHKSALSNGDKSGNKGNENEVQDDCGSYSGKRSGKGCRTQPLRIITHDTKTSGTGLTATTLKSVLQTALHLNISTLPVRGNDTRVNGSTGVGQSDGFTGLSSSNRLEAVIRLFHFLPLLFGLFNVFQMHL